MSDRGPSEVGEGQAGKPRRTSYWEDYSCGCVSASVARKRDLVGYCATHGNSRRHVWIDGIFEESQDACHVR